MGCERVWFFSRLFLAKGERHFAPGYLPVFLRSCFFAVKKPKGKAVASLRVLVFIVRDHVTLFSYLVPCVIQTPFGGRQTLTSPKLANSFPF